MKWKTVTFFGLTLIASGLTWAESQDVKQVLMPLMCNAPENAQIVADDCVQRVIELSAKITAGIASAGLILRAVTKNPLFKFLDPNKPKT